MSVTSFNSVRDNVRFERYTTFVTQITEENVKTINLKNLTVEQREEAERAQLFLETEQLLKQLQAFEKILNILVEDKFSRRGS